MVSFEKDGLGEAVVAGQQRPELRLVFGSPGARPTQFVAEQRRNLVDRGRAQAPGDRQRGPALQQVAAYFQALSEPTRLQILNLLRDGEWFRAGANAVLSFALCLVAVWLGHVLALYLNQPKGG